MWRMFLLGCLALALIACQSNPDQAITDYQKSIRSEADWLWNNMNYARTTYHPSDDVCDAPTFNRKRVTFTDAQRADNPQQAYLVDVLDSAAFLVQEAHAEWDLFCQGRVSAAETAGFLESRLVPAYERMNGVLVALAPSQPTPQPGST